MLVLTRKVGEKINVGEDIILSVLEINRGNVRLGIDAPRSVRVFRQEVYERIKEQNLRSSQGTSTDVAEASRLWRQKSSNFRDV